MESRALRYSCASISRRAIGIKVVREGDRVSEEDLKKKRLSSGP
jgi:hypothetical protein